LTLDDRFQAADFDGRTGRRGEEVDLLYVSAHGELDSSIYRAVLQSSEWEPFVTGFGKSGPCVAIFDTCWLVDPADMSWRTAIQNGAGPALRVVLGYATPATVSKGPATRGRAFVDNLLRGDGLSSAWLKAVHQSGPRGDRGVAVGLGDSEADANAALDAKFDEIPLTPMPAGSARETVVRYCH
jgi:hypothetical protein